MATNESISFAGTEWNDFTNFRIQGFDPGLAMPRFRWISGADSDGALLAEESHYDNAEMTLRIRVTQQTSMDNALAKIGTLVLALQEAQKNPLGSALVWTPAGSTKSFTGYVLGGEVTGLPIALSGDDAGWFQRSPVITVKFYRRPFWYGAEVTSAATVTNTNRFQLLTVASVTGDVPAEGRLVVTDAATQSRRHHEWGFRQRYYDAATNLSVDTFVTSGFGGTSTTRAGSFNTNVMRGTLTSAAAVAICGVGNLGHVGGYRVKARIYAAPTSDATADDFKVRLSWKEGDGPLRSNDYTSPPATGAWCEVDLGVISIPEKTLGTQRWTGQIEAYSEDAGDTLDVDYLLLIPTEGYGKGRAPITFETITAFSARDEFDQTAGNLNTKTLPVGGTWTTSGDATDITVETSGHTATRATTSDTNGRTAIASLAASAAQIVQIDFKTTNLIGHPKLRARHVDANNHLDVTVFGDTVLVEKTVASVTTTLSSNVPSRIEANAWFTLRLLVSADGLWVIWIFPRGSNAGTPLLLGRDSVLATGGALASGQVGFGDINLTATAATRNYDNFIVATPTSDAVVFSGRTAEIRHNEAIRQDSTGTYYGPISTYRGGRLLIPPTGSAGRTLQLFSKARRNDIDYFTDDQIADSTTATLHYVPRFLVAPR